MIDAKSAEKWLEYRKHGIGGSDAACIIGKNKYKSNVQLWREKCGLITPPDISDKPAVKYGKAAESHIRAMFALDYPEYDIDYHEFGMWSTSGQPFIFATLDGELTEAESGRRGILEIKTTTIQNAAQWGEWDNKIPDSYYVQVLHQMLATGWEFAILRAYIRYYRDGKLNATVRDYTINRVDEEENLQYLFGKEKEFYNCIINKKEPALILPEI